MANFNNCSLYEWWRSWHKKSLAAKFLNSTRCESIGKWTCLETMAKQLVWNHFQRSHSWTLQTSIPQNTQSINCNLQKPNVRLDATSIVLKDHHHLHPDKLKTTLVKTSQFHRKLNREFLLEYTQDNCEYHCETAKHHSSSRNTSLSSLCHPRDSYP